MRSYQAITIRDANDYTGRGEIPYLFRMSIQQRMDRCKRKRNMEELKEFAFHYRDGMITAHEMLYGITLFLARSCEQVTPETVQHDLADKLSDQLLKR